MNDICTAMGLASCTQIAIGLLLFYIVLVLVMMVLWICTLVHQAKRHRWVWFVLTLIFSIVFWIYWITWAVSPKFRRKRK